MVTDVAFSKADDRSIRSNQRFFYAIILTTTACLAIQGRKGQPDGRLKVVHEGYRARTSIRHEEQDRDTFVAR